MTFHPDWSDQSFETWLGAGPTEDELRHAYLALEAHRAELWTTGSLASYRRDRYDVDARHVRRLVQVKAALAREWVRSGQLPRADRADRDDDLTGQPA